MIMGKEGAHLSLEALSLEAGALQLLLADALLPLQLDALAFAALTLLWERRGKRGSVVSGRGIGA